MLRHIVTLCVRFRYLVVAIALLLAVYGVFVAQRAKLDVFPEFAPPQIVVQTEAPGLSAEQVETLVTRPIEYSLNGTPALQTLYSQSIQGLSVVTLVFEDDADIYRARQLTAEHLAQLAGALPAGVHAPGMGALASSTSAVLTIGLTSDHHSAMELRTFADWTVRQRLLGVPGVARVETFGGEVRQLQIQVLPDRMMLYGLSIDDIVAAAGKSTGVRGAGFIETDNQRITLRTEGQSLTAAALAEAVVARRGNISVRLRDIANVVDGPEPKLGDAQVMGQPGIVLGIHGQYGANTRDVTHAVETAIAQLRPMLDAERITLHPALFRPVNFIETSIRNINHALLIGGVLVIVVLLFFLANLRSAFIAIATIPLSLLMALVALVQFGASINTITLGGFAIAIGVVVDDAIVGLENVWRRLRENRARPDPKPPDAVVVDATLEVRSPIVYASFIVIAVFWPVAMMSGINGRLFAPLAASFVLATLASLIVAITLTPALCYLLLARVDARQPGYIDRLKHWHRRSLAWINERPRAIVASTTAVCFAALLALPFLSGEFLPEFKEGHYVLRVMTAPGTSIGTSLHLGTEITRELLKNPRIRSVAQQLGRAEQGEDTSGAEFSEFQIELMPISGEEEEQVQDEIRATLQTFPGISFAVTPFLEERIEEILSGGRGAVVINIFGEDLDVLDRIAAQIKELVSTVPGAAEVLSQSQSGSPELSVTLRPDRLRQYGFAPLDVLEAVQFSYQGITVAQTNDQNRVFDVAVILEPGSRRDPESIGNLLVRNADGTTLPLRELATIESTPGRYLIMHEGTRRRQQVTSDVDGRDLSSFTHEVQRKIRAEIALPSDVSVVVTGAEQARVTARNELLFHSVIAAIVIIMLLSLVLANLRNLLLVLANIPFALAGGVLILVVTGGALSIGAMVGFISLFGVSMRNSILMISHYEELVTQEGKPWNVATAFQGATERLLPIVMTALVVALGLLPIAIGSEEAGKEIEGPMAIVILGGLLTSMILNLLVLPTLALRFARFAPKS
ncbi:efflux RND transporter permease subunit [Steroidobacter cummioxidans]|uniref:efflux RND transporter permease subunit n=1 Tax=Steroidobacter cummioxidans TaxID=1803913 RepID=UPI000E31802A|nr:efflux RND transporter permease subunit [Steroidobacter cummioxidans]